MLLSLLDLVKIRREGCERDYITTFASWPGRSVLLEQFGVFSGHFAANVWISFPDGMRLGIYLTTDAASTVSHDRRQVHTIGTY